MKRIFDLLGSFLGIILLLPAFLIIWLFIKMDSKGPALINQARLGKDGKAFKMHKFRSMVISPNGLEYILANNKFLKKVEENDPRITKAGKRLRKLHLDELPQLINVLKGEMSLVGPRPALLATNINPEVICLEKTTVRPGLTGLAQVSGGVNLPFTKEKEYDLRYIKEGSLLMDIKIILFTLLQIFDWHRRKI